MNNLEVLQYTLRHMQEDLKSLQSGIKLVESDIQSQLARNSGQPTCPVHGIDYQDSTCKHCAVINGVSVPEPPTHTPDTACRWCGVYGHASHKCPNPARVKARARANEQKHKQVKKLTIESGNTTSLIEAQTQLAT